MSQISKKDSEVVEQSTVQPMNEYVYDLILTLSVLFGLKYLLLQFPTMWTFAGPISILSALSVATYRLKIKQTSWKDLGVKRKRSYFNLALWVIGALVATILLGNIVGSFASSIFANVNDIPDSVTEFTKNRFENVPGNVPVYIYWIIISWVIGGFAEEMLFRGFLISRFEKVFEKLPFAIVLAIIMQALIFGQQHMYYQGVIGFVETGVIGLISGTIYVLSKRRLWPLILSHGIANTLGMTMIFLGNN